MPQTETRDQILAASLTTWSEALGEVKAFAAALTVGDEPKAETLRQMALIHMEVSLDLLWRAHRK